MITHRLNEVYCVCNGIKLTMRRIAQRRIWRNVLLPWSKSFILLKQTHTNTIRYSTITTQNNVTNDCKQFVTEFSFIIFSQFSEIDDGNRPFLTFQ